MSSPGTAPTRPYKYDLARFNTISTVSFDHPDPSIFFVLAAPSAVAGTSNIEFGSIADRWNVARHTFRPPPFHRNVCSEFVGLISGEYIGKRGGFEPGCASLLQRECRQIAKPFARFESAVGRG